VNDSKAMKGLAGSIPRISLVIMVFAVIPFLVIDTYGAERSDLTELKEEKENVKNDIEELGIEVIEQYVIIQNLETELSDERDIIRELRKADDNSWEYIEILYDQRIVIEDIEKELSDGNKELQLLITEKLETIQRLDGLEDEIKEMEHDFINNKPENKKTITVNDLKKKIGITLSNTCIQMIKNNIDTTCPSYEELYWLDSSNQNVSGKFVTDDNGFFHRGNPQMTNSWKWYDFDVRPRIFVDLPSQRNSDMITIEITTNLDTFIVPNSQIIEGVRVIYHGMYVDDKCKNVIIDSEIWLDHIAQLIHYLRRGCVEGLIPFDNIEYIPIEPTDVYIGDSAKWLEKQWFNDSKILCKQICKQY